MDGFCCKVSNSDAEAKSQLSCEMIGFGRMDGIRFCSENKKMLVSGVAIFQTVN
jgi:hypothetical protein